jgi:hypothetical protein
MQILSTFKFTNQTSQGDESTNWKIYMNDKYGISLKYPSSWFPQDMTSVSPIAGKLAIIDFFINGEAPSISTEGHQGNELFSLYIHNNMNGNAVTSESKEQFLSGWTKMGFKNTTVSNSPAVSPNDNSNVYYVWYNDKIELSILSNDKSVDKTTFERIVSTITISPTP